MSELNGRTVKSIPFTGLVESLCAITLMCGVAAEPDAKLNTDDLRSILAQISEKAVEALAFAGATRDEIRETSELLLNGMSVSRENPN